MAKIEIDLPDDLANLITSNVGIPFADVVWPRGKGKPANSARAEVVLRAGVKALNNWILSKDLPKPFRILACDGGGFRGLYEAIVLERLNATWPRFLEHIDLLAGTSTGAIIVCGIAAGKTPTEMADLYRVRGPFIFADSWLDNVVDLGMTVGAQWSNDNKIAALREIFGDMTLGDLKIPVLITAFDLDTVDKKYNVRTWKPKIYNSLEGQDKGASIVDVLVQSSSAPASFPTHQGFVDGGVAANNPSMCAVALALKVGVNLAAIRLLSLGSGKNSEYIAGDHDWGAAQWALPISAMMLDGSMDVADYQCVQILRERYLRVNSALGTRIRLGDVKKAADIERAARAVDLTGLRGDFWG